MHLVQLRSSPSRARPKPVMLRRVPEEEQGENRNLWCPYYGSCLDKTLRLRCHDFSCAQCVHQGLSIRPAAHEMDIPEAIGWEELWGMALAQ